jgi:hypothetical protein
MSFLFSDMLGDHMLATSIQATSRFDEIGGGILYVNRTHRWNWGASFDQTPYVSSAFGAGFAGNQYVEQELRILQTDRGFSGLVSYPFSRAQRIEVNAGLRQIGLKEDITTYTYDAFTGQQLGRDTQTLAKFPTLNLAQTGAALVYDTSIFGAVPAAAGSERRVPDLHRRASRRPDVSDAGASVHVRRARPLLRTLRRGCRGFPSSDPVSRVSGARARLRSELVPGG